MKRRILLLSLALLIIAIQPISADESPHLVVNRLDCNGFTFRLEGDANAEYWVGIRGDCGTFGFLYNVFRFNAGHSLDRAWPEGWTFCWMNWDSCWRYGILQPQPEKIMWYFEVALDGEILSSTVVDLAIPCGYRTYLPLIFK